MLRGAERAFDVDTGFLDGVESPRLAHRLQHDLRQREVLRGAVMKVARDPAALFFLRQENSGLLRPPRQPLPCLAAGLEHDQDHAEGLGNARDLDAQFPSA